MRKNAKKWPKILKSINKSVYKQYMVVKKTKNNFYLTRWVDKPQKLEKSQKMAKNA